MLPTSAGKHAHITRFYQTVKRGEHADLFTDEQT